MARNSIAGRSTVVGTSLRAIASVFAIASRTMKLREVGVFNTTATAVAVSLVRFTNATGVGAGLTEVQWDEAGPATNGTGFAGHTADGAVGSAIRQASLPAAIGGGVIWTFGDTGILVAAGTANGIGIICPTGTGQILDYYFDWDE
jgi:hypothetical protein